MDDVVGDDQSVLGLSNRPLEHMAPLAHSIASMGPWPSKGHMEHID